MNPINVMRTWTDDVALAATRADEAGAALRGLVGDAKASAEAQHAIASGADFDDPFEAALALADDGNRGLWDTFSKSDAARTILDRAVTTHPGGAGYTELLAAREAADQASGDIGMWLARGGRDPLASLEASMRPQLERIRTMADQAIAAAPAPEPRLPIGVLRR